MKAMHEDHHGNALVTHPEVEGVTQLPSDKLSHVHDGHPSTCKPITVVSSEPHCSGPDYYLLSPLKPDSSPSLSWVKHFTGTIL